MENQNPAPVQMSDSKKGLWPWLSLAAVIIVLGVGYGLLSNKSQSDDLSADTAPTSNNQITDQTATKPAGAPDTGTIQAVPSGENQKSEKVYNIVGGNFYFKPSEIRVSKDEKIKINFSDADGFHDLVIDGYNIKTQRLQSGQAGTVEFVADKTGTFNFYCSVGSHRDNGMAGKLIVE